MPVNDHSGTDLGIKRVLEESTIASRSLKARECNLILLRLLRFEWREPSAYLRQLSRIPTTSETLGGSFPHRLSLTPAVVRLGEDPNSAMFLILSPPGTSLDGVVTHGGRTQQSGLSHDHTIVCKGECIRLYKSESVVFLFVGARSQGVGLIVSRACIGATRAIDLFPEFLFKPLVTQTSVAERHLHFADSRLYFIKLPSLTTGLDPRILPSIGTLMGASPSDFCILLQAAFGHDEPSVDCGLQLPGSTWMREHFPLDEANTDTTICYCIYLKTCLEERPSTRGQEGVSTRSSLSLRTLPHWIFAQREQKWLRQGFRS
ncbi:hypothetical protein VNO77_19902 [Canavalia gladiata]|uniref:Uncharacterized protein n=1 Tax=Canavalia gladiata TaxID=3824 RepID=A0AAN9QLW4_CANGL